MGNYSYFNIPDSCKMNARITKKEFYENAGLSSGEKKIITDVITRITLVYYMNSETINIRPYRDEKREYSELYVMEVEVSKDSQLQKLAETIMKSIPYPMVVVFRLDGRLKLCVSHQRTNQSDDARNVLEELVETGWIGEDSDLLEELDLERLRKTDYYALYSDMVDAISLYNLREKAGAEIELEGAEARAVSSELEELEAGMQSLRSRIKKESQFNRKMELNVEIKRLEKRKNEIIGGITR